MLVIFLANFMVVTVVMSMVVVGLDMTVWCDGFSDGDYGDDVICLKRKRFFDDGDKTTIFPSMTVSYRRLQRSSTGMIRMRGGTPYPDHVTDGIIFSPKKGPKNIFPPA